MLTGTLPYYVILYCSYTFALVLAAIVYLILGPSLYHSSVSGIDQKPWRSVFYLLVAGAGTLIAGRLYSAGFFLPEFRVGAFRLTECINQILIYSPFLIYMVLDRVSWTHAWLPPYRLVYRICIGLCISVSAIWIFTWLGHQRSTTAVFADVFHVKNIHHAVQVFLEDLLISLLLSKLSAALGNRMFLLSAVSVSMLFAFGHLPAQLQQGATLSAALMSALADSLLATGLCFSLYCSKDFAWFWPIHFAMDMMQFYWKA